MVVRVEFRNDENVVGDPDEPDVFTNLSDDTFVLLKELLLPELQLHWAQFKTRLTSELLDLFTMTLRDVEAKFGGLGLTKASLEDLDLLTLPYGFFHKCNRFRHLTESSVVKGMVEQGLVERLTKKGAVRSKMHFGHVTTLVRSLDIDTQHELIRTVLTTNTLDKLIKLNQTCLIADDRVDRKISEVKDPQEFFHYLAEECHEFYTAQLTQGSTPGVSTNGSGRIYCAAWFSQYLSAMGVWLQPIGTVREAASFLFPIGLRILSARMAVRPEHRALADAVFSKNVAATGTSAARVLTTFISLSACSNVWLPAKLTVTPMIAVKTHAQEKGWSLDSSGMNSLYRAVCDYMQVDVLEHKHANVFHLSKRLAGKGVDVFQWATRPTARNTAKLSKLVGAPVESIPAYISEWVRILKELLPLYGVKHLASTVNEQNYWLAYLYLLGEELAPKSFFEVDRQLHVNSFQNHEGSFMSAMSVWYADSPTESVTRVIPTVHKAWTLAAAKNNFAHLKSNPFDPTMDKVGKSRSRHGTTVRRALDEHVLGILIQENRRGDFAFARSISGGRGFKFQPNLMNPKTKNYEIVFVPDVPILLDVIMSSGMRNGQGRWLDSGEGDEFIVDVENLTNVLNTSPIATAGRRQGFLRIVEIQDGGLRPVMGMFLNTNKTGRPYEVPWIEPGVVKNVERLRDLNSFYFPLLKPIQPLEADVYSKYVPEDLIGEEVYPLFRDLNSKSGFPVSESRVSYYWQALLTHCQPLVANALKYDYPLIDADGSPLFDIHALRVTTVTVLIENGVSPEIVQQLVGHRSVIMTWYYNAVRGEKIHTSIQQAMELMKRRLDRLQSGDEETIKQIEREHFTERSPQDFLGLDFLRKHLAARSAPVDVFAHGICPGGSCRTGGEKLAAGRYAPVWRDRACSRCRYRVTGPAFLNGLVHRLNGLMVEIKQSTGDEGRLNAEAEELEDRGQPSAKPRSHARRLREERDEIFREWCAELKTVKASETLAKRADPNAEGLGVLIALQPAFDVERLSLRFDEVHDLGLLQTVLLDSRILVGGALDVPRGAEEWRDRLIHKILRTTDLGPLLYRLSEHQARTAMDRVGQALLASIGDPGELQKMIDGERDLTLYPSLVDELKELVAPEAAPRSLSEDAAA